MSAGLIKKAEPVGGTAKGVVRVSFPVMVLLPQGSSQSSALCGDAIIPMYTPVEVVFQQQRKLPGVGVPTSSASEPCDREQYRIFGVKPGPRLFGIFELLRRHPRAAVRSDFRGHAWMQKEVGRMHGMQVMVKDSVYRRTPFSIGFVGADQFGGVGAQQVMKGKPAWDVLLESVRPG